MPAMVRPRVGIPGLVLLCGAIVAGTVRAEDDRVIRDVVYAQRGQIELQADIYKPAGDGPFPAVLVVHGGAWRSGGKSQALSIMGEVERELRSHFGDLVFTTTVPRSVRLAEAPSHGVPAIAYDRRSAGAEAYWKVAMELVERT